MACKDCKCKIQCPPPACVTDVDLDHAGKTLIITSSTGTTEAIDLSSILDWIVEDQRFIDAVKKTLG